MKSVILEITACIIAAIFGFVGFFYGLSVSETSIPAICFTAISGLLVATVVIYLSQLAELMSGEGSLKLCKVLNKLIYVTIISQILTALLMV